MDCGDGFACRVVMVRGRALSLEGGVCLVLEGVEIGIGIVILDLRSWIHECI